ncbi:MAG: DUF393 domain-containing protein [Pseudomonadota bacterium]
MRSEPYSYQNDPGVPAFDDSKTVFFMDAQCALCTGAARFIARNDTRDQFRICPVQTDIGKAVLQHYGLDPSDPSTWMMLHKGRAYTELEAVIKAGGLMKGLGRLLQPLVLLPKPMRGLAYRVVARNRYRVFGKADMCAVPDEGLKRRLILDPAEA